MPQDSARLGPWTMASFQYSRVALALAISGFVWGITSAILVDDTNSLFTALENFEPKLEAAGYLRVAVSDRRSPAVVSVNTTLSRAAGRLSVLNSRLAERQLAIDISAYRQLTITNLPVAMAIATELNPDRTGLPSYVFVPCFNLQPRSTLRLEDLIIYWDVAEERQVWPNVLSCHLLRVAC